MIPPDACVMHSRKIPYRIVPDDLVNNAIKGGISP
jgi:hypothetical protein